MKKLIKITLFTAVVGFGVATAAERDPFLPYTWSAPAGKETAAAVSDQKNANPLIAKPVTSYTVVGVVVSPNDALAVLKSRDKNEYFAYIGDPIGSEGGIIETISSEGITVDIAGKIIPLKVSNRFENQDETQTNDK